jgi:hypothetical protein
VRSFASREAAKIRTSSRNRRIPPIEKHSVGTQQQHDVEPTVRRQDDHGFFLEGMQRNGREVEGRSGRGFSHADYSRRHRTIVNVTPEAARWKSRLPRGRPDNW